MCFEIEILQQRSKASDRMYRIRENQGPLIRMVKKQSIEIEVLEFISKETRSFEI
jgi:hypothetical protein